MTFKRFFLSLLIIMLASCVTTQGKLFAHKVSKEKELKSRLTLAVEYLSADEPEAAMRHLKLAMEIDPKSAPVHEVLALTLEKMGDDDQVEKHFKKMVRYDSSYTRGRANYGSYLIRQKDYKSAYKEFTVVTQDVYYAHRPVAYQQLAICAEKLDKKDEVITYYKKALAIDSSYYPALFQLAKYSFEQGDYADSQKYLDAYRAKTNKSSARSLLLGVKLSRIFEDKDNEASYALALKNLYPKSEEYLEYLSLD